MTAFSTLRSWLHGTPRRRSGRPSSFRPMLEQLEDRLAPSVITVAPQADAYVNKAMPATNAGASTHLYTEPSAVESYVRFSVTGLSGSVQSAKLRVYVLGGASNGPAVFSTGASWAESAINWNNR